jgi:HK97 family phage major capsid protein
MKNLLNGSRPRALIGTVRADATDPKALVAQINGAFEELKSTIDDKIAAKADDVVLNNKIDAINATVGDLQAALDAANTKIAAGVVGTDKQLANPEQTKAFNAHVRTGDVQAALTKSPDTDGGFLAPVEWDRTLGERLMLVSPIRENAEVQMITGAGFRKNYLSGSYGTGWVGEVAARPTTSTPTVGVLDFVAHELYANPAVSQQLLEDALVDVEAMVTDGLRDEFGKQENIAFLSGDGVNKPRGILTYVTGGASAAVHPYGAITQVTSGGAATIPNGDAVIRLIYDLPTAFSGNAKLYANRNTLATLRLLKDTTGNYLWQPSYAAGQPSTLAGAPVVEVPDMPNVAANAIVALYGDMRATYLVVDRVGLSVLRDPYTNKPFVHFYTRKRVGGGVKNPEPMRALRIAA